MPPAQPKSKASPALFDEVGGGFLSYYGSAQGQIRREVIRSNLIECLPADVFLDVLDLGCGEGQDTTWMVSRGHRVTGLDPSGRMLAAARAGAKSLDRQDRLRLRLLKGGCREASNLFGEAAFDLVMCHGVLMYQDDDPGFLKDLARLLRPGGRLSLVTKNAASLAYRSASDGQFSEARRLLRSAISVGRLGVQTQAHYLNQLKQQLEQQDFAVDDWFGIKIFSDSLTDSPRDNFPALLALETDASRLDPYRQTARLLQVLARKV